MEKLADQVKSMIDQNAAIRQVEGIVISVQMHGFQLFSGKRAATDYVSWQDMRAVSRNGKADIASRITTIAGEDLIRRNGVILKNSHSLCPLYHFIHEEQISSESFNFSMMGDSLIRYLTGEISPIHPTVAASSGLFDLQTGDWNRELIDILSLRRIQFPPVSGGKEAAACYKTAGQKIPVYTAVGDHQAAVLGCAVNDGDMVINIGTGGQISFLDKGLRFGNYETRPYFSGRHLRALTQLPSGRSLNVLMNLVTDTGCRVFGIEAKPGAKLWERINGLAEEALERTEPEKIPRLDMSFFDSYGGTIQGIDDKNLNAGSLFLAAYRHMADAYFDAFRQLGVDDEMVRDLVCAGGVLHKTPLLRRLIKKRFALPLRLSPCSEDVMSGLLCLGRWHSQLAPDIIHIFDEATRVGSR
jgi:sugar (pentulose or hexulose) kinase